MKRNIYQNTIQEVKECFQEGYFHDIKEEVDDFLFALQHWNLPTLRQAILKVPGFNMICDQMGLLNAEPTLLFISHDRRR